MKQSGRVVSLFLLIMVWGCILSACTESPGSVAWREVEYEVETNSQKGLELMEEGNYTEAIRSFEQAIEYVYQLDPSLVHLDHEVTLDSDNMQAPFNNISWAYHELGDYKKSLEYIEQSLLMLPNTNIEFTNKGNALYGLDRGDEALVCYDLAIDFDELSEYAYYGKGIIYYDNKQYKEAIKEFDTYLSIDSDDVEAVRKKIYSHLGLYENQEAIDFVEGFVERNPESYDAYQIKGEVLESTGEYDEIKAFYEKMREKFPEHLEAQMKLGELYYDYKQYDLSLDYYNKLLLAHPDDMDIYIWIIRNNNAMGELGQAKSNYAKAVTIDDSYTELHTTMGNILKDNSFYLESIEYFDKSIKLDPLDENAYMNKLNALYRAKRNLRCAEFGKEAMKISAAYSNIAWYTGKCNFELGNYSEAIDYFQQAIEIDPTDYESFSALANAYLAIEDYERAEEYSEKSLGLYSEDWLGLDVQSALKERRMPLGKRLSTFFSDNYLYKDNMNDLDKALSKLNKADISNQEIAEVIDSVRQRDDIFTYTLYGDEYDQVAASNDDDITYEEEGDISYFRINEFGMNTDDKFIEILDKIPNTQDKILVIDLRSNTGGYTDSSNNILDVLLPDCVTSTLIYRDGYTSSYYSDASHTDFQRIYIFVDEYTASASELLTLGLKTYLNNVTVVGRDTFGKGVGQRIFEDEKNKIIVFVVIIIGM